MSGSNYVRFAPAKINIHLQVIGKRTDQYHELFSLFAPINFGDTLRFQVHPNREIAELKVHYYWSRKMLAIKDGAQSRIKNYFSFQDEEYSEEIFSIGESECLLQKVWKQLVSTEFFSLYCRKLLHGALTIDVFKQVPPQSGMGGGSSDAASFILFLKELCPQLSAELLYQVARSTGADVPFFLFARSSTWGGIGDFLYHVQPAWEGLPVLILRPNLHSATGKAFAYLQRAEMSETDLVRSRQKVSALSSKWKDLEPMECKDMLFNDFTKYLYEELPGYKDLALRLSMLSDDKMIYSGVTGSGSAMFILFERDIDSKRLLAMKKELQKIAPFTILAQTLGNKGLSPSGKAADFGSAIPRFES